MSNKSKKIRNARIIATDIFMFVAVIAIVFLMMLVAMGFKFNDEGNLEQSGLLQLTSIPGSAKVTIDGNELLMPTKINKLLSIGEHDVKVTKTGYDTWNSTIKIDSGLLTEINWVRLFPLNPKTSDVDTFATAPTLVSASNSRKYMLVAEENNDHFDLLSLQEEKIKSTSIAFSDFISIAPNEDGSTTPAKASEFNVVAWNNNDNKILMKYSRNNEINWVLVNAAKPKESLNLTSIYNKKFVQVLFENDSATKAWALSGDELYQLDLSNKSITGPIATKVQKIANNGDVVAYIATSDEVLIDDTKTIDSEVAVDDDTTANKIFIYKDGEESATIVADLGSTEASSMLEMGTHWSSNWLAYNIGAKMYIRSGVYPSYNKNSLEDFQIKYEKDISHAPVATDKNVDQRIIMLAESNKVTAFDLETKAMYSYETDGIISDFTWLDNYMLWQQKDTKLVVWDFDGNNHREIVQKLYGNYPTMISANNKYLYYFTSEDIATEAKPNTAETQAESDGTVQAEVAPITSKQIYHLTRMELQQ